MKLILLFLCVTMSAVVMAQTKPAVVFNNDGVLTVNTLATESMSAFKVYDAKEGEILSCEVEKDLPKNCKVADGHTLDEVIRSIVTGMKAEQKSLEDELNRAYHVVPPAAQPAQTWQPPKGWVGPFWCPPSGKTCMTPPGPVQPAQKPAKPKVKCYSWPIDPTTAYCCDGTHHKIVPAKPAPKTLPLCKDMKVSGYCIVKAGEKLGTLEEK